MTRLERAITPLCVNHPGECGILTLDDSLDAFAAVRGADLVVTAMAEGRHAAQGIVDWLGVKSVKSH